MVKLVCRILCLVILFFGAIEFLELGVFGDLLLLILGGITIANICEFKDSKPVGVIIIVDEFRRLRSNFSLEVKGGYGQSRKTEHKRGYSLAGD